MARVFISHAGGDTVLAAEIRTWLLADGHEVFLDRDSKDGMTVGEEWEQRLYERLRWADAVACVITKRYLHSMWCAVEIGAARIRGSRLLPIRAEAGLTHPLLTVIHHIDAVDDTEVAREALRKSLRAIDLHGRLGWPDDQSPYPGLRAFDIEEHLVFFGRGREIDEIAELLRSPAERSDRTVLTVVGPSGCGKSSLVRAGVLPLEDPYWSALRPILPGADPVGALAREIATAARKVGLDWSVSALRRRLHDDGLTDVAHDILVARSANSQQKLLVVIDQFEELLTLSTSANRAMFADVLAPAIGGPIQVLATLRSESLDAVMTDPDLSKLPPHVYPVRPFRREVLRDVIEEPARVAGIGIDDELVERLIADTDSGDALPLLAFALERLGEGVHRGGQLSFARYEETGGVQGALILQANAALDEARASSGRSADDVIDSLLRLVTVDEKGRPTRGRVPRADIPESIAAELDAFVAERLVITDRLDTSTYLSVAHEAFLSSWPQLARAITAKAGALRARGTVEDAAREWDKSARPATRLWDGDRLAAALSDTGARMRLAPKVIGAPRTGRLPRWMQRRHLVTERVDVNPMARDFLERSFRRDRFRRRRLTLVLSMLLVVAIAGLGIAVAQTRVAVDRQHIATARQLLAQADGLREIDPRTALQLGLAAYDSHPDAETRRWLFNNLSTTHYAGTLGGHRQGVHPTESVFSPDGRYLAVQDADGSINIWNLADRTETRLGEPVQAAKTPILPGLPYGPGPPAFSADGRFLFAGAADPVTGDLHNVRVWDRRDPARPRLETVPLAGVTAKSTFLSLAPDVRLAATHGSQQPAVQLWDFTTPAKPRRVGSAVSGGGGTSALAFSPDGRMLAIGITGDTAIVLWDIADPNVPKLLSRFPRDDPVYSMAFSPDGRILAAAGSLSSRGALVLDVSDPALPHLLGETGGGDHTSSVVAFARTSRTLATANYFDKRVQLWDLTGDPARPKQVGGPWPQTAPFTSLAIAPDGQTTAAGGENGQITLWTTTTAAQPRPIGKPQTGHAAYVNAVAVSADGITFATGGVDGTVDLWETAADGPLRRVGEILTDGVELSRQVKIWCLALSPDGKTLATGSEDGTVALWDISDRQHPRRLSGPLTGQDADVRSIVFSPGGELMGVASDRNSLIWDVSDPAAPRRQGRGLVDQQGKIIAFDKHHRPVAIAEEDGNPVLWDMNDANDPRKRGTITGADMLFDVAYTPTRGILAVSNGQNDTAQLWDVADPDQPKPLGDPLRPDIVLFKTVFSADGNTLAAVETVGIGRVVLWDLSDPAHAFRIGEPLKGEKQGVVSAAAAFTPDGDQLVTAGKDGEMIEWDLRPLNDLRRDPVQRACEIAGSGLNEEDWAKYIQGIGYRNSCSS